MESAVAAETDIDRRCDEYAAAQRLLLPRKRRAATPIGPPVRVSMLFGGAASAAEKGAQAARVRVRYAAAALDDETVRPGDFVLVSRALHGGAGRGGFVARVDEIFAQAAAPGLAAELRVRAAYAYVRPAPSAPLLVPISGAAAPEAGIVFAARAIVARCALRAAGAGAIQQNARGLEVYVCAAADAPACPPPPLRAGAAQLRVLSLYVQFGMMLHDCACAAAAAAGPPRVGAPAAARPAALALAACGRSELVRTLRTDYVRRRNHGSAVAVRASATERAAWRGRLAVRAVPPPPVAWRCAACLAQQHSAPQQPADPCFDIHEIGDAETGGRRKRALYSEEDMPLQVSVCGRCAASALAAADLFAHAQRCAVAYAAAPTPPPPATIDAWFATLVRLLEGHQ